jgi:hypothetical protein
MKREVDLSKNASKRHDESEGLDGVFNNESDSKPDITDINTNSTNNINDIVIEFDEDVESINVAVLLRLKPSTVKALDDLAWQTRKSRNAVAQILLDKAISNVKIKKK